MTIDEYAVEIALEHVMWLRQAGWTPAHIASLVGVTFGRRSADHAVGYDDAVYALAKAWHGLVGVRRDDGVGEINRLPA